jgi:hypothetical protein
LRHLLLALSLASALVGCSKPTYEYKTIDWTTDERMKTTAGVNQVMREMTDQGWQLVDPKDAGKQRQVWRREK